MPDLRLITDYVAQLGATLWAKTCFSVLIGVLGILILLVFLTNLLSAAAISGLLPVVVGFNCALTGYNVIEKTRHGFTRKRLVALAAGLSTVLVAALAVNLVFWKMAGLSLIGFRQLLVLVPVGAITGWLGGALAVRYLKLS